MQDLTSEIDIFALEGEEGIRKKMEEAEMCLGHMRSLRLQAKAGQGWTDSTFGALNGYRDQATEQLCRALIMCEKQKCSNVQLVVKVVEKALEINWVRYFLYKPNLTLMDHGHFVRLPNRDKYASPQFFEFFILTFKKARKVLYDVIRLENDIFDLLVGHKHLFIFYYMPIELFLFLLRYGVGMGDMSKKPEEIMAMLLTNIVVVVIHQENGDASFTDCRKLQEMVYIVKISFLFNSDLFRQYFKDYIMNVGKWLKESTDFDMPKEVEECFLFLESRGLVDRKKLFQIPSLKQMCKVKIRGILNQKWELPEGIYKLEGIPRYLTNYLDLKID